MLAGHQVRACSSTRSRDEWLEEICIPSDAPEQSYIEKRPSGRREGAILKFQTELVQLIPVKECRYKIDRGSCTYSRSI